MGGVKTHPRRWNEDDARAHPIWTSPLFRVHSARAKEWRNLGLHTVKDLLKHDGTSFTNEELLNYVREKYHEASEGGFWLPNKQDLEGAGDHRRLEPNSAGGATGPAAGGTRGPASAGMEIQQRVCEYHAQPRLGWRGPGK